VVTQHAKPVEGPGGPGNRKRKTYTHRGGTKKSATQTGPFRTSKTGVRETENKRLRGEESAIRKKKDSNKEGILTSKTGETGHGGPLREGAGKLRNTVGEGGNLEWNSESPMPRGKPCWMKTDVAVFSSEKRNNLPSKRENEVNT